MKITNLRVNHLENPLGYELTRPAFSWQVDEACGKKQTAAKVRIASDEAMTDILWESSDMPDSLATVADITLAPRTCYYWQVSVTSDADEAAESEVAHFETAKEDEPWQAIWIKAPEGERLPYFEKAIAPKTAVAKARLYISGLGLYEAYWSGRKIGDEYLTPHYNNYAAWVQYQTYDVTELITGTGTLSVLVGDGWYGGRMGYFSKPGDPGHYGSDRKIIVELHLVYEDGSEDVIGTDESWLIRRSQVTSSTIYDGEIRDDTLPSLPSENVLAAEAPANLVPRYSLPVRCIREMKAAELIHTPAGETVLDIGQNMVGSFALRVREKAGAKIHIQVGEVLQGGNFYRDNLRSAKAEYIYTSDGTEQTVRPHFTFYGFRYVKIEGAEHFEADDFTAMVLTSDLPEIGQLTTGLPKLNRLIENVRWGQRGNFVDVPTDCPQRDERLGWTGDAQVFSATSSYLSDSYAFYRKYLHDMNTEQAALDGKVPDVVPSLNDPVYQGTAAVWGDAVCIIPWTVYLFSGDKRILEDSYEGMKAWVEYIRRIDGDKGGWGRHFHYGDWLALDHPSMRADQVLGGTDESFIAYVYYMHSMELVSRAAAILGNDEDAALYSERANALREEIRNEYFAPNGRCVCDTQTGLLLALEYKLTPNPEACRKRLKEKLTMTGWKLQTGFTGTPFLNKQLTLGGMEHEAYDILLNEEYPGWLHEVNLGATTIWERWNSLNDDGSISSTGMNSFNHYAYGSILEWMFRYIGGINPVEDTPGFRKTLLRPVPDLRLAEQKTVYRSAAGLYELSWKTADASTLELFVQVPFGAEATLILPEGTLLESIDILAQTGSSVLGKVLGTKDESDSFAASGLTPLALTRCTVLTESDKAEDGTLLLDAGRYVLLLHTAKPMKKALTLDNELHEFFASEESKAVLGEVLPEALNLPEAALRSTMRELFDSDYLPEIAKERIQMLEERLSAL